MNNASPKIPKDMARFETNVSMAGGSLWLRFKHWISFASSRAGGEAVFPLPWISGGSHTAGRSVRRLLSLRNALLTIGILGVGGLMWFSLYLAAMRIYQVDEACNIFVARLLANGITRGGGDLFQILLSWMIPAGGRSVELFSTTRMVMVVVFWSNWILMALATGQKLFSRAWVVALIGAATLAPVWDYGIEARHDNLLLSGVLLMWSVVRFENAKTSSYFLLGLCTVMLQFVAIKAFVYTIPISLLFLVFPRGHADKRIRIKVILGWLAGALAGFFLTAYISDSAGVWKSSLNVLGSVSSVPVQNSRFWPWKITLSRLLTQTPLLLIAVFSAVIALGGEVSKRGRQTFSWDSTLPEVFLFLVALGALCINPNPYPYNLLHLVPYGFLLAYRYGLELYKKFSDQRAIYPVVGMVLVFAHLVPFGIATLRHLDFSNARQERLMSLAEDLTAPDRDPVFDASGMVSTRPIIDPLSLLHGQSVKQFIKGPGPQIRDMLATHPAAVVIPNYRTDWLPDADHDYLKKWYVSVADDFWVLGKILPPGGGDFQILLPGRYRISTVEGSDLSGTYAEDIQSFLGTENTGQLTGTLDGVSAGTEPVELTAGIHNLQTSAGIQPAVVWVGPTRSRVGKLGRGDHTRFFCNWY